MAFPGINRVKTKPHPALAGKMAGPSQPQARRKTARQPVPRRKTPVRGGRKSGTDRNVVFKDGSMLLRDQRGRVIGLVEAQTPYRTPRRAKPPSRPESKGR